ncbi:MAG TPA: putative sulfate/molybdate transporter [Hyphomicrobiaceae bacterium]|nr:putative sulfate/molybdate transporter [Hyphomicrobiaceae bacterium]
MQSDRGPNESITAAPPGWRRIGADLAGMCGDLGTFLPHVIGAITVAGLAPAGILVGFGAFLIASGLFYGLPMAVQPMKAVSAVLVTGQVGAGEVAAAGLLIGTALLVLGLTGSIGWLARAIPQSVSAGLQLGLGLSMGLLGFDLMWRTPWLGIAAFALLAGLMLLPRFPAAPAMLAVAVAIALGTGAVNVPEHVGFAWSLPALTLPTSAQTWRGLELLVVPQLPLTLTNAVIVAALVCRDLFPDRAGRASERNLALSSGIANLLLAPLGAMPMCHGAGGVQAQHRFGARTGLAPICLGIVLLVLGLGLAGSAAALLALVPLPAVGALLLVAGGDLALSRRLFDARPSCYPVIALAGAATLLLNPAIGLIIGCGGEIVRKAVLQALGARPDATPDAPV